jgi:hypothetical protein
MHQLNYYIKVGQCSIGDICSHIFHNVVLAIDVYHHILKLAPELRLSPLHLPEVRIYQIIRLLIIKAPVIILQRRAA